MRGEVDLLYEVPPEAVEFVRASAEVSTFSFLRPYAYLLGVNFRHPVLSRQDVRTALNAAIDRQAIVDRVLGGRGQPAFDHVFPSHWAYDAHVPVPSFDARRAGRLLDASGLLPTRPEGERRRLAHHFRFTCLVPADYPLIERMALVVQKQLGDVGVDMAIEAVPLLEFQQRLGQGRFDAYLFELLAGHGFNWSYWFWRSPVEGMSMVRSGYSAADAALDRLRFAHRENEQAAAVRGLQEVMRADPPGVFLCWGQVSRAVVRRFEVPAEENRDILRTIERWRLRRDEAPR
jgi:peptide/nickel transport system substrate-binding protein